LKVFSTNGLWKGVESVAVVIFLQEGDLRAFSWWQRKGGIQYPLSISFEQLTEFGNDAGYGRLGVAEQHAGVLSEK
jgi:hypothetical protein